MSTRACAALVAIGLGAFAACSSAPPRQAESARAAASADPWEALPHKAEWLYATGDFSGPHAKECEHVLGWIRREAPCEGATCAHGDVLAEEWLARCPPHAAAAVDEVRELEQKLRTTKRTSMGACGAAAEAMLKDGCGARGACLANAQKWATACGEKGSTPLVVRMVERVVERVTGERRVSLDLRDCGALRAEVAKATRCEHRFACGDALAAVDRWRARCDAAAQPTTLVDALLPRIVLAGAERFDGEPATLARDAMTAPLGDLPLPLADGSGVVVSVCGKRVLDLAGYAAARAECEGGAVAIVRAWNADAGEVEVRASRVPHANAAAFERDFPAILVAGEREAREARDAAALGAELDEVARLAAASPPEAATALATKLAPRLAALRSSAPMRAALARRDDALAPAFAVLGERKLAAAKKRVALADLFGLVQRGTSAPLADVDATGAVVPGAGALELDTVETLPVSTAAYRRTFAPAHKLLRGKKLDAKLERAAVARADEAGAACAAEEKKLDQAERALLACASGRETCDDARVQELSAAAAAAREGALAAHARLVSEVTGAAVGVRAEVTDRAATAGCLEPWW